MLIPYTMDKRVLLEMRSLCDQFEEFLAFHVRDQNVADAILQVTNQLRAERGIECLGVDYCSARKLDSNDDPEQPSLYDVHIGLNKLPVRLLQIRVRP